MPVEAISQARPLVEAVLRWTKELGMRFQGIPLQVRLIDPIEDAKRDSGHVICLFYKHGRKITHVHIETLEIVKGLAPIHFQGVLVHELGHVWMLCLRRRWPQWIEEGFCDLLSYRFYIETGTEEAMALAHQIEANPNPIYRHGFTFVRDRLGLRGLEVFVRREASCFLSQMPDKRLIY